ncbi:MAG: dihydropteroate synthase [Muribaculaceae bacterium]|nr:dihydropteroate synthase [Muribaculaceae bacterium]
MQPFSLNIRGRIHEYHRPAVMGIINITPDSFFAQSRVQSDGEIAGKALKLLSEGADMLDVGAYSSRPGAGEVPEAEECRRLENALRVIREAVGDGVPVSVDTFRASVARKCVEQWGADIINDISGGMLDDKMFETVAELHCPYILMHMRGTPATMQSMTQYNDVTADVIAELSRQLNKLEELGVADVIIDPGFGFAKTLEQNYELMRNLRSFDILGRPVLVGVSRKSMLTKLLQISVAEAELPTAVLGAVAIERGAAILRVHDVVAARQSITILNAVEPC